jgi:hypothetical protein
MAADANAAVRVIVIGLENEMVTKCFSPPRQPYAGY